VNKFDLVVVGSGLFGSVISERASRNGYTVAVIEARDHIGGNCYTYDDPTTGVNVHKYGPHIFHTDNKMVWDYICQFTEFNNYRHVSKTKHKGEVYSIPVNLDTINKFFKTNLTPNEAKQLIKTLRLSIADPKNFEEQAMSIMGKELYYAFFYGYTVKQWGIDPKQLPASVARRLPLHTDYNTNYYTNNDTYQGIPVDGYTPIFERMLDHPNIKVFLSTTWESVKESYTKDQLVVYTGPIDRYYDYCYGELNWRTLDFKNKIEEVDDYQGVAAMNYPDVEVPYTRVIEHKHFNPERKIHSNKTLVTQEFSRQATKEDTPYYPVKTTKDLEVYEQYRMLASQEENVIIGGRLGEYMYYDMHQVIGAALSCYKNKIQAKLLK
jgi:UDP-galactopyranose mutase